MGAFSRKMVTICRRFREDDQMILYYTRLKIKHKPAFCTTLSLMTNTATLDSSNKNTNNWQNKIQLRNNTKNCYCLKLCNKVKGEMANCSSQG